MIITGQMLRGIAGTTEARLTEDLSAAFTLILPGWKIDTPLRAAHWLGQTCLETDYWRTLQEYGGAEARYAPFWGRGAIQLTWQSNYVQTGIALGCPISQNPDLVATPGLGTIVGCMYWAKHNLNRYADENDAVAVSRGVNRGSVTADDPANHEADRVALTAKALQMLEGSAPTASLDTIAEQQAALLALGYYHGTVDGISGKQTVAAIKAFQADAGLAADGVIGPKTRSALLQRVIGG